MEPSLDVYATDLYDSALSVAKTNATSHQVEINFLQGDTLMPLIERGIKVNGLISNPPYIDDKDVVQMDESVLNYEPHSALFAENNGYAVYDKILEHLPDVLLPNAKVVFEIGYNQGQAIKQRIVTKFPTIDVQVIKDINHNDRTISFVWC